MNETETLKKQILKKIEETLSLDELENIRISTLGKKGSLTEMMKTLGQLPQEERKLIGQSLNSIKIEISEAIETKKKFLEEKELETKVAAESIDISLPIRPLQQGRIHPVSQVMEEMLTIFAQMGFELAEGPDIEDDFHCFEALNFPKDHPARQMQATFFMKNGDNLILRTHTSPVQIRIMEEKQPPIKIVAPGRVYRCDYDMTHTPMFHQIEGLVIDKETNMGHLKGVLMNFMRVFFEVDNVPIRFRPSFFPFTEPSAEVDIGCSRENGEFKIESGKGWMEILGCGMVHPNVIKNCGLDPNEYQGFAFGFGLDRFAMLKYGIPDLRSFFDADTRWIKHYGFLPLDIPSITSGLSLNGGQKR